MGGEKMKKALFPLIAMVLVLGLAVTLVAPVSATFYGQLEILKLDENGENLYGATFVISPDPTDWVGDLTVVDNGMNDDDPQDGVLVVTSCWLDDTQEYTVTETVAPPGYKAAPPQSGIKITTETPEVTLTFVDKTTEVGGVVHPINKVGILAPWLGLALLLIGGMTWFTLRRRTT